MRKNIALCSGLMVTVLDCSEEVGDGDAFFKPSPMAIDLLIFYSSDLDVLKANIETLMYFFVVLACH